MTETAQRDPNYVPYVFISQGGNHVPTNVYVDETTHRLLVNATLNGQAPAVSTGGYTPSHLISAGSTNATNITQQATTLGWVTASNINASPRYLKLYDKASAPTVGSDTPVQTYIIPGNTSGAGTNIPLPAPGMAFLLGFSFAITTGAADADTGVVGAGDIVVNYGYK